MRRSATIAAAGVLLCAITSLLPVRAAGAAESSWLGNVGAVSDYRFRGISQTDRHGAVQAGVEFDAAGGGYVGGWDGARWHHANAETGTRRLAPLLTAARSGGLPSERRLKASRGCRSRLSLISHHSLLTRHHTIA